VDDSRNNFALALVTMGEGWHNNTTTPERRPPGLFWWEIDLTYYVLKGAELVRHRVGAADAPAALASRRPTTGGRAGAGGSRDRRRWAEE